jgi:hypothetical protein
LLGVVALAGCHARLRIDQARAESVELEQVKSDAPPGTPIESKGPWTELNLEVPRASLSGIAWLRLPSAVHVIDCRSGALRAVAPTKVYGIDTANFGELRQLIRQTPREQHYWLVGYVLHAPAGSCAKLDDGSYLLEKVSSDIVPVKFDG